MRGRVPSKPRRCFERICTEHVLSAASGCTGKTGKTATCTMVIVYLVSRIDSPAASSSHWLQMRVYPLGRGGDGDAVPDGSTYDGR